MTKKATKVTNMKRLILLSVLAASPLLAADFQLTDMIELRVIDPASDGGQLGRAVALTGDTAWFGAPQANSFDGRTWRSEVDSSGQFGPLSPLATTGETPFRFGDDIAVDGDWAAVGYYSDNRFDLYHRNGSSWILAGSQEAPDVPDITIRGMARDMDLKDDLLVVSAAPSNVGAIGNAGAVLVFRRDLGGSGNWGLEATLIAPSPASGNNFGISVSGAEDTIAVGDDVDETVYIYRFASGTWDFDKTLVPVGQATDDNFGVSVAVEGDIVAVGATNGNDAPSPSNSGSVHLFHRDVGGAGNFGQIDQIAPSTPDSIDRYGEVVVLNDGVLMVGAPGANQAYAYADLGAGWQEIAFLVPPPAEDFFNALFGSDVDYDDGRILVGAQRWDDTTSDEEDGAVFMFQSDAIMACGVIDAIFCDRFEQ
ncbi:FG-GAP repeat protein [Wenzhouxiangella sp. EGI_FJ10305]|uniref:FG-GAP repeat protein n=1 Tax=Wenzhouxiangella sp. EGI_FJ10305 TaxID=3243768 RepID=UPI0035DFA116